MIHQSHNIGGRTCATMKPCCMSLWLLSFLTRTFAATVHAANNTITSTLPKYKGFDVTNVTLGNVSAISSTNKTDRIIAYNCTLTNEWTNSSHPADYPFNEFIQFATPFLVAHSSDYVLWANQSTASPGLKGLVQAGALDAITQEVNSAEDNGTVLDWRESEPLRIVFGYTDEALPPLQVDFNHSYITSIAPILPSPDWFQGFYKFNTIDSATKTFFQSFTIEVYPWDLGTKAGDTYTSTDGSDIFPFDPIKEFTVATVPSSGVFLNKNKTAVLPVARWTCDLRLKKKKSSLAPTHAPTASPVAKTGAGTSTAVRWLSHCHYSVFVATITLLCAGTMI